MALSSANYWLFDHARLAAAPWIQQIEFRTEVGSTNDLALELARAANLATPLLVLAERQTAGRGRGANRWWSAPGALTFSLVVDPARWGLESTAWHQLSLVAAVAVCETVEKHAPGILPGIRWPNDVYLGGRKVAGILVEIAVGGPQAPRRLVMGVGLNVNNSFTEAPDAIRGIGTSLGDASGRPQHMTDVLLLLLERLKHNLVRLAAGDSDLFDCWQRRCLLRGRTVEIDLAGRRVRGFCGGVARDGALELETAVGTQRFFGGVLTAVE